MRAVKVEYTVRPDYVETNKANIQKVMEELQSLGDTGVIYSSHLKPDGRSFVHFAIQRDEEAAKVIGSLQSFQEFRTQLKGGVEVPPSSIDLEVVGKSFDL